MNSQPTPRRSTRTLAETVMVGGDHLVHLDQLRGDLAGAELRAVAAAPAPTTAGHLLKRLTLGQCLAVVAAMAELGNRWDRQMELSVSAPVTLDMDGSLSEVYGRHKELASFNHEGRRGFLSQFVTWDERRRILVADLLKGSASEKPGAAGLLRRALRTLPAGHGPVFLRADSGFPPHWRCGVSTRLGAFGADGSAESALRGKGSAVPMGL